ncbi:pseudouridine 5'-phosphatase [Aureococcus anophagefferens]|uniref:Pseudouridine 5'-phosphatase n=1 Tax=Aureococcus anophagefferens TaxID=44056 RepID=A0ABR1FGV3_AURAN
MALRALLAAALAWITSALITPAQRLARPRRRQPTTIRMDSTELDVGGVRLSIYDGRVALQWDRRRSPGAFLGTYAGDALTGDDYEARYGGAAVPEYVVRVDGDLYLGGRAAADAKPSRRLLGGPRRRADDDAGPEAEAFDLDAPFLDPDDERDQGVVLEKVKGWYRADPQAFEAAYVRGGHRGRRLLRPVRRALVQAYNVWLPPAPPDLDSTLDVFTGGL